MTSNVCLPRSTTPYPLSSDEQRTAPILREPFSRSQGTPSGWCPQRLGRVCLIPALCHLADQENSDKNAMPGLSLAIR